MRILSLCDYTGNMLKPWAEAGHECVAVDIAQDKPPKRRVEPTLGSKMHTMPASKDRQRLRSETPMGFARAVYEANK